MLSFSTSYYLCLLAQVVYPTYASFKALQSSSKVDDTQWLTYWVVYGFLSTLENGSLVVLKWVPLYYEAKLLFVLWLVAPQTQGAFKIYEDYLVPLLKKYGRKVDPVFSRADAVLQGPAGSGVASLAEAAAPRGGLAEQAAKQQHAAHPAAPPATPEQQYSDAPQEMLI